MTLALVGNVDNRDSLIESLQSELNGLRRQLREAQVEAATARNQAERAVGALRKQLMPLYQALRMVFGEMDAIGGAEFSDAPQIDSRKNAVWESWKQKLGGKDADAIEALLLHGEMSVAQLRVAMKCHIQTAYASTAKLQKLGLLNKRGSKYSLKEL